MHIFVKKNKKNAFLCKKDVYKRQEHAFTFMEQAFSDGQEMVVFVTELTITPEIAVFLSEHRIERYETCLLYTSRCV